MPPVFPHKYPVAIGTLEYASTGRDSLELERHGVMTELMLRLRFRITNGNPGPTGPKWMAIARIIRSLKINVNSQDFPVVLDGAGLCLFHHNDYWRLPYGYAAPSLVADVVTDHELWLPVTFWLPRSGAPMATALPVDRIGGPVTVEVDWGDASDIFEDPGAAAVSNVVCDVIGHYDMNMWGNDHVFGSRNLTYTNRTITINGPNNMFRLDERTGRRFRSFHVVTLADEVATNAILAGNTLQLKSSTWVGKADSPEAVQIANDRQMDHDTALTGVYSYGFEPFGQQAAWMEVSRAAGFTADAVLEFGASLQAGTNTMKVYTETIQPFGG